MPRADSGFPHNFMANFWVFKDDESESDAKTKSRHRVCLLLVESPLLAWRVHAQSPLLAHCVNTRTCTHTHLQTDWLKKEYALLIEMSSYEANTRLHQC